MAATNPPRAHHLTRNRNGIYYWRRRVPRAGRRAEVALSLRTRRYREAEHLAAVADTAATSAAGSTTSRASERRSPRRRSAGSPRSTPSKPVSGAGRRRHARRPAPRRAAPFVLDLFAWLEAQLGRVPGRSTTADAIRYALNHRGGLARFLDDGRVDLDTNTVERAIRPVILSRKNALFAGSDEGGEHRAAVASLVETCKLNGVNPERYLADLLTRPVEGWPQSRLDEPRPWRWATPTAS